MNHALLWLLRRGVIAPAVIVLTTLMWVTLPAWLILAALVSPALPGRWRALRLLWIVMLYVTCEALLLLVLWGLWFSSGFGRRVRTRQPAAIARCKAISWRAPGAPLRSDLDPECSRR